MPSTSASYAKLQGKVIPLAPIQLNKSVIQDLTWFTHCISNSAGVNFLEVHHWDEGDAEISLWTNASNIGLAFWSPEVESAFVESIKDSNVHYGNIFFNKALAVISAIDWAAHLPDKPWHILIHTNSMNTVDIFHLLMANLNYILLLFKVVEIMMDFGVDIQVVHILDTENALADALSCLLFQVANTLHPGLNITIFQPP